MERIEVNQDQVELVKIAKARVKKIRDFYLHMILFMIAVVIYVLKTYYGISFDLFPLQYINRFVMGIWGIIVGAQVIEMFFTEVIMGKSWEEKQIKKMIEKKQEKQIWK